MLKKGPKAYSEAPTKGEKERLSRERDKIMFVHVRFENRQVVRLRERGRRYDVPCFIGSSNE